MTLSPASSRSGAAAVAEGAKVRNSANISIPDSATTALTFDTEDFDNDGMHDGAVNPGRLTVVEAGIYVVGASIEFAANATGWRIVTIRKNAGATPLTSETGSGHATQTTRLVVASIESLVAGDFLDVAVFQSSTAALNVLATAERSPAFSAVRVGPAS